MGPWSYRLAGERNAQHPTPKAFARHGGQAEQAPKYAANPGSNGNFAVHRKRQTYQDPDRPAKAVNGKVALLVMARSVRHWAPPATPPLHRDP